MKFFLLLLILFSQAMAQEADPLCLPPGPEVIKDDLSGLNKVFDSLAPECPQRTYPQVFSSTNLNDLEKEIKSKFDELGINVEWSRGFFRRRSLGGGRWSTYREEDLERLRRLANIAYASFKVYPKSFLESTKLKTIYLTKDLVVAGQDRKAMPDPASRSLLFGDNNDLSCDAGLELRIHHEFFHYLEGISHNGNMRPRSKDWNKLNPNGFDYGNGGHEVYNCPGGFVNRGHSRPGFMSAYALTAEEEDKAETFAWMMTRGYASRAQAFMLTDESLAKKREYILQYLKVDFSESMGPEFFSQFVNN